MIKFKVPRSSDAKVRKIKLTVVFFIKKEFTGKERKKNINRNINKYTYKMNDHKLG